MTGACSGPGRSAAPAVEDRDREPTPVIVDYSPTLSDVPALLYLASHPDLDLRAVTLAGTGESDCEPGVRNTLALLRLTGHDDVPVACGPLEPLVGDRDWPAEFIQASNTIEGVYLPGIAGEVHIGDAVALLVDVLAAAERPVVVVTLGPLTNLALAFDEDPDLTWNVDRVVTMGGAVAVPGNVSDEPTAEWNLYIDPESVRRVLESGVELVLVPLDATNSVPGNRGLHERLARSPGLEPGGNAVRQLYRANLDLISSDGWYFWDELAAVAVTDESVVTLEEIALVIDDAGATRPDPSGATVNVATSADAVAFATDFVDVLSGGRAEAPEPFTADELAYLDAATRSGTDLTESLHAAFTALFSAEDPGTVAEMGDAPVMALEEIFDAYGRLAGDLDAADVPERFVADHARMSEALGAFLVLRDDVVGGVREILASDPDQTVEQYFAAFDELIIRLGVDDPLAALTDACGAIGLEAALRGIAFTEACAAIGG